MLAELAAANAAFSVIKQAVQNSGDIAKAGSAIAKFVGAKEDLQKKASKKGGGSDLEEFMALEQIREKEEQLKQFMIYCGRPGLWGDWQRFQAKARIARREAEEAAKRKRKQIIEISIVTFLIIVGLGILACFVLLILHTQGRL
jgi:molecular chaperone GrpE (heat shock protein)